MSCPWRPNTWEKVAWLQVRVSSMAVPLAHAERRERGRRVVREGQQHCVTSRWEKEESGKRRGRRKEKKRTRERREARLQLEKLVCDLS